MNRLLRTSLTDVAHVTRPQRANVSLLWARHNSSSSSVPTPSSEQDGSNVPRQQYPNLMQPDPFLDLHESAVFPPTKKFPYESKVVVRNDPSMFTAYKDILKRKGVEVESPEMAEEEINPMDYVHLTRAEIAKLHRYPLIRRIVTQQTGKGKIRRHACLTVVGNGDGLVGYGEGKDAEAPLAMAKAFAEAVRNMDYVERFEKRTVWTEMETKLGSTRIILRPRPVGFGLHCNPNIHQVLKAAGIKDASAKVWGSRNPVNVIKALFRMLQAGNAPLAMGNGIGGSGKKLDKGSGIRGKADVERERGRKLVNLRTF